MRTIHWTDESGRQWQILMPEGADDPRTGIPVGPPNVSQLDWGDIQRDLHNALADRGLWTWLDVVTAQNALNGAIVSVMHHRLVAMYKAEAAPAGPPKSKPARR